MKDSDERHLRRVVGVVDERLSWEMVATKLLVQLSDALLAEVPRGARCIASDRDFDARIKHTKLPGHGLRIEERRVLAEGLRRRLMNGRLDDHLAVIAERQENTREDLVMDATPFPSMFLRTETTSILSVQSRPDLILGDRHPAVSLRQERGDGRLAASGRAGQQQDSSAQRGTSSVVVFLRRGRLNPCTYFFDAGVLYLRA